MRPRLRPEDLIGTTLADRYRVLQHLASGGIAHVFVATRGSERDERVARIAIKLLRPEHRSVAVVARFQREALAAGRIHHPNVVEVGPLEHTSEGLAFFTMELLVGVDLGELLAHVGSFEPRRAVALALDVARALGAAHVAGVVHRDVKPENVFIAHAAEGRQTVKLLDFGLAAVVDADDAEPRSTSADAVGTPAYMAPEQAQGAPPHPTADVYALGVVLYEMLTGRPPFRGRYRELVRQHATQRPDRLAHARRGVVVSRSLERLVERLLEKDPLARLPDGNAACDALRATDEGRDAGLA